ncbi:hypothetical protein [Bowmanella dokdonensis]|uniref:Lipoprotein n=1 Tax=Bowmanella dokdonensis TaxID=751969 RepID=A0A939DNC5_9ALTE|nr:hypothetical protein [Bowmanella dokdonensis]MBN7825387.1 hypothetical protein [Bowmanella dokdonensis]
MKTTLTLMLLVLCITGCSNKAVYNNFQINKRNECLKLPPTEYDRCMEGMDRSYEEYEKAREEVVDQ